MSANNIEFSKQGIKFSYNRFLSDSASGFILIIIAIITYYHAGITNNLYQNSGHFFSNEIKTFLCLLLFMISTPLGLMINGLSWLLLGMASDTDKNSNMVQ
ncbi:MAG: hypothetical protein JRJ49_05995 [Deltaproteobacteria bacterium]|nr:hypothetical protein [Deltaproteobacteria bacterium]